MGLTKRDKDFWLNELKEELQKKIAVLQPAIDRCLGLAMAKAMKDTRLEKDWSAIQKKYAQIEAIHEDYEKEKENMEELVDAINDKLEPYRYDKVQYGRGYSEAIKVGWTAPNAYGLNAGKLEDTWIERLAREYFLEEVMIAEGVTEPLEIAETEKRLERNIMLATSAGQLKAFLEVFMSDNEISL